MRLALALLFGALLSEGAQAEVHKCRMADGSLAFLDHPCPEAATVLEAPKLKSEVPFAWLCGKGEPAPIQDKGVLAGMPLAQQQALESATWGLALSRVETRTFFDKGLNVHLCVDTAKGPSEFVVTPEGRVWMNRAGKVERVGKVDRSSRFFDCSGRITTCFTPNSRSLDQCVYESPICTTSEAVEGEPPCCESVCITRYRELRAQDVDPLIALDRAFRNEACSGLKSAPGGD